MILMVLCWLSLLLPYGLGARPLAPLVTTAGMDSEASILPTDPPVDSGKTAARTPPNSYGGDSSAEDQQSIYFHFPDEGPNSTALADILSRLVMHMTLTSLIRSASTLEMIELLTASMWCTMVIMGTLVFGWLFLVLAWRVYWSVHEASKSEPVTMAFLFSIPGLRYLNNHIRYHLFETPLQPRRRFASFVGASAYGGKDKWDLDELDEFSDHHSSIESNRARRRRESSASMIATGGAATGPLGPGEKSQRRRSFMRLPVRDHGRVSPVPAPSPVLDPSMRKRYSIVGVSKSDERSQQGPFRSTIEDGSRRGGTTKSPTRVLPEDENEFKEMKEGPCKDNDNTVVPIIKIDSDDSLTTREGGPTSRRSSADTEFSLGEASDVSTTMISDDGEASVVPRPSSSMDTTTFPIMPKPISLITPESSPSREPVKSNTSNSNPCRSSRDSGSWQRASAMDPSVVAVPPTYGSGQQQLPHQSLCHPQPESGQQQPQSKLFKRLAMPSTASQCHGMGDERPQGTTTLCQQPDLRTEHSKLSRHFTKVPPLSSLSTDVQPMAKSVISKMVHSSMASRSSGSIGSSPRDRLSSDHNRDSYAERIIHEGDLTPPPGFHHRRHSSGYGASQRIEECASTFFEEEVLASSSSKTTWRQTQVRTAVMNEEGSADENGDTLLTHNTYSYPAILAANNSQRRRTSLAASPSRFVERETLAVPVSSWRSRLRLSSEAASSPPPTLIENDGGGAGTGGDPWPSQWRWFTGEPDEREPRQRSGQGWTNGDDNVDVLRAAPAPLERPHSALSDVYSAAVRPGRLVTPVGSGGRSSGRATPETDPSFAHPNRSDQELEVLGGRETGGSMPMIRRRGTTSSMTHQHRINLGIFDDLFSH